MKKIKFLSVAGVILFWSFAILDFYNISENNLLEKAHAASTGSVTLSGTILQYLALTFTSGSTISFGNMTPGTPVCNGSGTVVSISTNAANGYTLGISDGSGTNSGMRHTDAATYISDISGTIAAPIAWTTGSTTGVGVTLFAADTTKEVAWGTGTTACDGNNKWAGVPATSTTGHTVTGFRSTADTSSWGWKVDVPSTQKTGVYSGTVLFTSAATLS